MDVLIRNAVIMLVQSLRKISLKSLVGFQLRLINYFTRNINPFSLSNTNDKIIQLEKHQHRKITSLLVAHKLNFFVRLFQAVIFVHMIRQRQMLLTGNTILCLSYWGTVFSTCHITLWFLREKNLNFVQVLNSLFMEKDIQSALFIKFAFCNISLMGICMTIFWPLLIIFGKMDPISLYFSQILSKWSLVILKGGIVVFETWNFSIIALLGSFIAHHGMFSSYIALYKYAKKIEKEAQLIQDNSTFLIHQIKTSISCYHHLQMYTSLVNDSFQKFAVLFKPILISFSVFLGVVLFHHKLRGSTSTVGIIVASYSLFIVYAFMAVGYYLPGILNSRSKTILEFYNKKFISHIISSKRKLRIECRLMIRATKDVRLMIGDDNFYEKDTALNILHFLISQTINIMLLT